MCGKHTVTIENSVLFDNCFQKVIPYQSVFTVALALRSRGLVIGSREKEEKKGEEEEKNLQIAIRCLRNLFD